jgi:predicted O-methyltransferase YrrM
MLAIGCGGGSGPSGRQQANPATPAPENISRYDIDVTPKPIVIADRPENPYKGSYEFNPDLDWFSQNVPVWNAAMEDYKGRPELQYLEIGCFEGRSAVWMLENVLTDPTSNLTCVDPYQEHIGEAVKQRFLSNVAKAGAADRFQLVQGFSQEKLRELPLDKFDIIYIDGDHRAAPVLEDAVLSWRLLKVGGLMIFDDYRWEVERQPPAERPLMAIDFFTETFKDRVEIVHRDYQLILRKTLSY